MARIFHLRDSQGRDPWRDDTSRQCCDGRCFQHNPSQGGSCPLDPPQQRPKRTPRHLRPRSIVGQALAFIAVVLVVVLCVIAGAR
jgi:hypothetical protein